MKRRRMSKLIWGLVAVILFAGGWGASAAEAQQQVSVSLAWDANTEADLGGYKVYWCDPPATPATCIDSAVATGNQDIGKQTTVALTQTFVHGTVFAVTAYDVVGNESGFSNRVIAEDKQPPVTPGGVTIIINIVTPPPTP